MDQATSSNDDELDSMILIAIVVGSTGFLLMVLGGLYYLSRLGDVPSRKAVAANVEDEGNAEKEPDTPLSASVTTPDKPPHLGETEDTGEREELIEIYAPAGKLGVILDTPGSGAPIVHEIRPTSVLLEELQVGDRIIALDDEDVRAMSANRVSKLISRKMENSTRKFSVLRTIVPNV